MQDPASPVEATHRLDKNYWESRWEEGATGWRVKERATNPFAANTNRTLTAVHGVIDDDATAEYLEALNGSSKGDAIPAAAAALKGATVFLPLCGDTPALSFFTRTLGCNVIGVDIAAVSIRRAIEEQFQGCEVAESTVTAASGVAFTKHVVSTPGGGAVATLYVGDAFALMEDENLVAGVVDFVYDRGSMMAIEPGLRAAYISGMRRVLAAPGQTSCRTFATADEPTRRARTMMYLNVSERPEGPEQLTAGPPFHVSDEDVFAAYGGRGGSFVIPLLANIDGVAADSASTAPGFVDVEYAVVHPVRYNAATLQNP